MPPAALHPGGGSTAVPGFAAADDAVLVAIPLAALAACRETASAPFALDRGWERPGGPRGCTLSPAARRSERDSPSPAPRSSQTPP
ncbi:MAG: hypothetical protein QMD46_09290 [Methanomicrobiales archaeon]|nr:hypothetical protein [Methanomicrobiales archaeon]